MTYHLRSYRAHERGVTSLVIVMFTVLMLVTVSVSFIKLMVSEETRANDTELSQGAYDSALAGVEDGKRVLTACQAANYDTANIACKAIVAKACTTVSDAGLANAEAPSGEVYLKTNTASNNGKDYQQAYTCVKINRETKEYVNTLPTSDSSAVIPLKGAAAFTSIEIYWRLPRVSSITVTGGAAMELPILSQWNDNPAVPTPALLRTQLIQYRTGSLNSAEFDNNGNGHTLYLYPKSVGLSLNFATDSRRSGTLTPKPVPCAPLPVNLGYNCKTTITLPSPIGGDAATRQAYLRLTSIYAGADYMIHMIGNGGSTVLFDGVQPSIDSTGRAGDVFRRVDARVELIDTNDVSLYPRATLDVTKNVCKTFTVSSQLADYGDGKIACDPTEP